MQENLIEEGYLPEVDGHEVYFARYGNPNGPAILSIHGGPGSSSKVKQAMQFDLSRYQVILYDQRGCGKSVPQGSIEKNTTQDLVDDIERLRAQLAIDAWFVAGNSWGSTLALVYAQAYPKRVKGLLLSSIFLASPQEEAWAFTEGGVSRVFPDVWERRLSFLQQYAATPQNAPKALLEKIQSDDTELIKQVAAGVLNWEWNLTSTVQDVSYLSAEDITDTHVAAAKIFLHYEAKDYFLEPNQILQNLQRITRIPTVIVHGRFDVLCPAESAWLLKKGLDTVQLEFLPSSAHSLTAEGQIAKKLLFAGVLERWGTN